MTDPDRSLLVFKRFDRLAAQNIGYLQQELAELQQELDEQDDADWQYVTDGTDEAMRVRKYECLSYWKAFEREKAVDPGQRNKWQLVHQIRARLKEYR